MAVLLALLVVATAFVPGYGFMADELYFLSCADQLAWGYVDHPPLSIFVLAGFRAVLGDSLLAVRLVPALFAGASVFLVGALARELGGGKAAQGLAALAWAAAPVVQAIASYQSMNIIECFLWSGLAVLLARFLRSGERRLWPLMGVLLGIALLNKVSTLWLGIGLGLGLLLTNRRSLIGEKEPWIAAALALAIFLPHLGWQMANAWPLIDFVRGYAEETAVTGTVLDSPIEFVGAQIFGMNPAALPLWLAGLWWYFRSPAGRPFQVLAWVWLGVFGILISSGRAQAYYLTPAFPILLAAGGVACEGFARGRRWVVPAFASVLVAAALLLLPVSMPLLSPDSFNALQKAAGIPDSDGELPVHLRYRVGWPELAEAVRAVHDSLAPEDQRTARLLATDFPTAGALDYYGPRLGLPSVSGTHNNYWLWGLRGGPGEVMIVVAAPEHAVLADFSRVEKASEIPCRQCAGGVRTQSVFVVRGPKRPLEKLWSEWRDFR